MRATEAAALAMCERLPSYCILEWCQYKGTTYVAQPNIPATERAGKPMLDLSYCLTAAMNESVLLTVQYDKSKFAPAPTPITGNNPDPLNHGLS